SHSPHPQPATDDEGAEPSTPLRGVGPVQHRPRPALDPVRPLQTILARQSGAYVCGEGKRTSSRSSPSRLPELLHDGNVVCLSGNRAPGAVACLLTTA